MAKSAKIKSRPGLTARLMTSLVSISGFFIVLLGAILYGGALEPYFSPIGQRQAVSSGFLLMCLGCAVLIYIVFSRLAEIFPKEPFVESIETKLEKLPLQVLEPIAITGLLFFMYYPALFFSYFADDFNALEAMSQGPLKVIFPMKETYHYAPVNYLLLGIPYWLGTGGPTTYRIINLGLYCLNSGLVYRLAVDFKLSRFQAFGATLMHSFFFLNYDPLLWPLGGCPYMMAASFTLISFLSFIKFRQTGFRRYSIGFIVFYILSIYINEITIALLGVCFFYDFLGERRKSLFISLDSIIQSLRVYVAPLAGLSVLMIIKILFTDRIAVAENSAPKLIQNAVSAACLLAPFNNMNTYWIFTRVGQNPAVVVAVFLLLLLSLGLLFIKAGWKQRVMIIWTGFFILPAIVLADLTPRYFYLPAVGWAVLMAGLIETASIRISQWPSYKTDSLSPKRRILLSHTAAFLFYACVALQGQQHSIHVVDIWGRGNGIINRTLSSTMDFIARYPEKNTMVVVDQPTWYRGDDFNGLPLLITPMHTVLKTLFKLDHPRVESYRLHSMNMFDEHLPQISRRELESMLAKPDTLVIIYDSRKEQMVLYESTL